MVKDSGIIKETMISVQTDMEESHLSMLSNRLTDELGDMTVAAAADELEKTTLQIKAIDSVTESAFQIRDAMLPRMAALRVVCDEAEPLTSERFWPFPTYDKLLFGVR